MDGPIDDGRTASYPRYQSAQKSWYYCCTWYSRYWYYIIHHEIMHTRKNVLNIPEDWYSGIIRYIMKRCTLGSIPSKPGTAAAAAAPAGAQQYTKSPRFYVRSLTFSFHLTTIVVYSSTWHRYQSPLVVDHTQQLAQQQFRGVGYGRKLQHTAVGYKYCCCHCRFFVGSHRRTSAVSRHHGSNPNPTVSNNFFSSDRHCALLHTIIKNSRKLTYRRSKCQRTRTFSHSVRVPLVPAVLVGSEADSGERRCSQQKCS